MYTSTIRWWVCFQTSSVFRLSKNSSVAESLPWASLPRCSSCGVCFSLHCWTVNLWIGFATKQVLQGRNGGSTPGAWSIFHVAPEKQHLQPCLGARRSTTNPLIRWDDSADDNLRWSEKLHRRQRCSNNGKNFQMSSDHKSQKNDPLKKLYRRPTLFSSYCKPPGSCSDQRESTLRRTWIATHTKFLLLK